MRAGGPIIEFAVGPSEEDLPTLFCKSASFGACHDNAQLNLCRGIFSRCVHDEGHGTFCAMQIARRSLVRSVREKIYVDRAEYDKKTAHVKEICWRVRRAVLSKRPVFLQRMRVKHQTIDACTSSDVKEAFPFILLL